MVDRLDAMYPKGVFKEFNEKIRKVLGKNKKK